MLKDCSPDAQVIFLFMVYSDRQMRVADATIKQLLANETSMTRDSMLGYVDELSDDRVVANDVVTMLEIDGLIVYTGDYDWRVQLTDKGCKAAQMGLLRYLKRQKLIEKMKEYKLFVGIASAIVSFVSMLITLALTIYNAVKL